MIAPLILKKIALKFSFPFATLGVVGMIYFMYFHHLFIIKDYNWESMSIPMAAAILIDGKDYSTALTNLKEDNSEHVFNYPRKRFVIDYFIMQAPVLTVCYMPFVKAFGLNNQALAFHSAFFYSLAIIGTAYLANRLYGKWHALIAVSLLALSLSWQIHFKNAVPNLAVSACLMIGLAIAIYHYSLNKSHLSAITIGLLLGLIYLCAWIIIPFAGLLILFHFKQIKSSWVTILSSFFVCVTVFTLSYAAAFNLSFWEIHQTIYDAIFYRFNQGQNPSVHVVMWMKPIYAFKQLFIDMQAFDHPDKYLEGYPAIHVIFSIFFFVGLWKAPLLIKKWIISIFLILCSIYLFANRYAILALPAMAIVAAHGLMESFKHSRRWIIAPLVLAIFFSSYHQYYFEFIRNKRENFEADRMRGHADLSRWLKSNYDPNDTLIILGDSVTLNPFPLLFHNFDNPYRFKIWKENITYKGHWVRNTIYIFSCKPTVDWKAFGRKNPQPSYIFKYNGKPLIVAYRLQG